MTLWVQYPDCWFLCLRDRFPDKEEKQADKKNVIILRTNDSIEEIFNRIMEVRQRLWQWDADMAVSVLSEQEFQPLVDLSESIIGNHMDVMDATFKLLAYTKNIPIDDAVTDYLIAHGYHDRKTVERFVELRRIEEFEQNDDLILSADYEMCKYETVKRVFHENGRIRLYVVMHCNRKKVEPGLLELFRQMLIYVKMFEDKRSSHPATLEASRNFLLELLEKKVKSMDEAIDRAAYASIPFQKNYCLFMVSFRDHLNIPLENLVMAMSVQIPAGYVLAFRRRMIILKYFETDKSYCGLKDRMFQILKKGLVETPCTIGVSNIFDNLWQITAAMDQAGCAIEYGVHVHRGLEEKERTAIAMYDFEQSFLTLIIAKSVNQFPGVFGNCFTMRAIEEIEKYDRSHGTGLLSTLEAYLDSGKKATEVCRNLHMHRNTVLYHIEKIESLLEVSLRDEEVCMKLKLGLLMRRSHMQELVDAGVSHR